MYATRAISLAMVLLGSLAVKAAPMPAVRPDHVDPGTVMRAMPLHFHPPLVSVPFVHKVSTAG